MKTASLKEIKTELESLPPATLLELCIKVSKFKKENKELLTYLLFGAQDERVYIASVREMLDELFLTVNKSQLYFAKKTIRKIVRTANRYIKYSNQKTTEPDLLLHICKKINELNLQLHKNTALQNIYNSQIKKIRKAIVLMHEEEQYDYLKMLEEL